MFDDIAVRAKMEAVGYVPQSKLIYKAEFATTNIQHFVFLSIDSRGYLTGAFGLRNRILEQFSVDELIRYGHPNRRLGLKKYDPNTACAMVFDFDRIDRYTRSLWPRVRVADQDGLWLADLIAGFVDRYVFPLVKKVENLKDFLNILLSDSEPMPWAATSAAFRAAQIVAILKKDRLASDEIIQLLKSHERMIAVDLLGKKVESEQEAVECLDRYVNAIVADLEETPLHF